MFCFFSLSGDPRYLHVLTLSFPTRRSSDLRAISASPDTSIPRYHHQGRQPMDDRNQDDSGLAGKVAIVAGGGAADDGIGNGRAAAMLLARSDRKSTRLNSSH